MNSIEQLQHAFTSYLIKQFNLDKKQAAQCSLLLNTDGKKQTFGDLNSNAALALAKQCKQNPRAIAEQIISTFTHPHIKEIRIAGPGFINITLKHKVIVSLVQELIQAGEQFFTLDKIIPRKTVSDEFVSANPTGPLHFGHGRSGVIGDVLGNILRFLGHLVIKEYYINDAGNQIIKLGYSFKIRCQQQCGNDIELPEEAYHGEYLVDLAAECIAQYGKEVLEKPDSFFQEYAKTELLNRIKKTLKRYNITFDIWFSEKTLHQDGSISKAVQRLQDNGYLYEEEGALWFASKKFGDDKDRVIKKSTGEWTYAAADIAYLLNKVERGFDTLAMVMGQDHHSYAVRLNNIRQALDLNTTKLDIILYQLVRMKKDGKLMQMSKRTGTMTTLNDVISAVGTDVARFFYLHRKADAQLEFDLDLALKKTSENPVYYVQYAYVRTKSILEKAAEHNNLKNISPDDAQHLGIEETPLLKKIVSLKDLLASIDKNNQVHLLTYYVIELADAFHSYYSKHRVVSLDTIEKSRARLLMITLLRDTLALSLTLLGISKPEKM